MLKTFTKFSLIGMVMFLMITSSAFAQSILPFQGQLFDNGSAINGTVSLRFEISDLSWIEEHPDVPIENGIYTINLGSINPLPVGLFADVESRDLAIRVNETDLSPVQIYPALTSNRVSVNLKLRDEDNRISGEWISKNAQNTSEIKLNAPNDSSNVRIGGITNPYQGQVYLYDSLGVSSLFMLSRQVGGYMDIFKRDENNNLKSGIVAASQDRLSFLYLMSQNFNSTGRSIMINHYTTARAIANGPLYSDTYMRSGTDWQDNQGRLLAAVGNARDEAGSDPTGASGFLSLWGTNTFNVQLLGKRWENNNLPNFSLFGYNDNGGDWWMPNVSIDVQDGGGENYADISLNRTANGGGNNTNVFISSNYAGAGAGGMDLRDENSENRISLNGSNGNFSISRVGGGASLVLFDQDGAGGMALQDDTGTGKLFYLASNNEFQLRDPGENNTITLFGNEGGISITGTLDADQIFSTDGTVQTSDVRFKTNIKPLSNALSNTLALRGVSYNWLDPKKAEKPQVGVIAQEVEAVYPELVHTKEDGYKAVNYAQMVAVLIEAVRELNEKIESLEKENMQLKAEQQSIQSLEAKVANLERLMEKLLDLPAENASVNTNPGE